MYLNECDRPECEAVDMERGVMRYMGQRTDVDGKPVEIVRVYCSHHCLDADRAAPVR